MTTGKGISGNKAYLRELKANIPATATAIAIKTVTRAYLMATRDIFNCSRQDGFINVCPTHTYPTVITRLAEN